MDNWKQAFWLAKFELRKSLMGLWSFLIMLMAFSLLFVTMMPSYLEKGFVGMDLFFLIAFGISAVWVKPKEFQYQKIDENMWGSPLFMTLSQLPIKKEVLVRSRFLIYFIYAIPFQILLLSLLYIFSAEVRGVMSIPSYIAFSSIWLAYGLCSGGAFPAVDAGDRITLSKSIVQSIILLFVTMVALTTFHLVYGNGIIYWTMMLADRWTILSLLISAFVIVAGLRYWKSYTYKKMNQIDYLK